MKRLCNVNEREMQTESHFTLALTLAKRRNEFPLRAEYPSVQLRYNRWVYHI